MKKSKFTESRIPETLQEAEFGPLVADVCRKRGINIATFCQWKRKYTSLTTSRLKRDGKRCHQRRAIPKVVEPAAGLDAVQVLEDEHHLSRRQACRIAGVSRSALYKPRAEEASVKDAPIIEALNGVVSRHGRWGFWKCFHWLRSQGHGWNPKRVHRVYCNMKLNLPRRARKRVLTRDPQPLRTVQAINKVWSLDFMRDTLYNGRPFRTLSVIDEGN